MSIKTIKEPHLTWINIDRVDDEAIKFLKDNYQFHPLDLEDLGSEQQTPKIDPYKNYVFAVVQFPVWNAAEKTIVPFELDVFAGDGYVITIERQKSKEMKRIFYRCLNNRNVRGEWTSGNSGYLLYHILENMFACAHPVLNHIGKNLSAIEHQIFSEEQQNSAVIRSLAFERRNVLNFRRIMDPQRYVIETLGNLQKPFFSEHRGESLSIYFDNVADYIGNMWAIVESYKETLNGLHITVESLINRRTNKTIRSLTIISVSLLPLTLLSGIYGMNVTGLPFAHRPLFVLFIFMGLSIFIVAIIMIMKWKKEL